MAANEKCTTKQLAEKIDSMLFERTAISKKPESCKTLKQIAHELVESVRRNTSIDWQLKESVQAKIRTLIKRILRKYKYPPDDPATGEYTTSVNKVLNQAELLGNYWSNN